MLLLKKTVNTTGYLKNIFLQDRVLANKNSISILMTNKNNNNILPAN